MVKKSIPLDYFQIRPLIKDPFIPTEKESRGLELSEKSLIFPLDRKGPSGGFILSDNTYGFDSKDAQWLTCWEAFYEGYKRTAPEPKFHFTWPAEDIIEKSQKLKSRGTPGLLLSWPLLPLLDSWLVKTELPWAQPEDSFKLDLLTLVGPQGSVAIFEKTIHLLFPLPAEINSQLYVSQCLNYFTTTGNKNTIEPLNIRILTDQIWPEELGN